MTKLVGSAAFCFLLTAPRSHGQPLPAFVSSTNDGNGLFSYTFTVGDASYVWGLKGDPATGTGSIGMTFYGVVEVINPAGWHSSVNPQGWVQWRFTNGIAYLGQPPVTFSIRSSSTVPAAYDDSPGYPRGSILGSVYDINTHDHLAGGFQTFPYLGPAIPEPATVPMLAAGAVLLLVASGRKRSSNQAYKTQK